MKQKTKFFCTECGNETARWSGQCPACGAWNTLVEAPSRPKNENKVTAEAHRSRQSPEKLSELDTEEEIRFSTGVGELDRVLGGGAVRGSVVLVGRRSRSRQIYSAVTALRPYRQDGARAVCLRRGEPPPAENARPALGSVRRRHICSG